MISDLKLENFKSWKSAHIPFGRITGLFGANSSGKSSLIQFLLLLKQTREASDRNMALELNGPYVELGTMSDFLTDHDTHLALHFTLGLKLQNPIITFIENDIEDVGVLDSDWLRVASEIKLVNKAPKVESLSYKVDAAQFWLARSRSGVSEFRLGSRILEDHLAWFKFVEKPDRTRRAQSIPGKHKFYQFPYEARAYYQNAGFLIDLELAFEEEFDRLYYLGPLRMNPQRDYLWGRSTPRDVGIRGERAIEAILAAQAARERRSLKPGAKRKLFDEMIAYWLRQMGLIHEFWLAEIAPGSNRWRAEVQTRKHSSEVLLTDVGFGVSQVLPVITLLYYVPEGSTVILEQPEIHLHPLAQAELADVIINVATHRNVQVVLESHSEHLLLRLQRRIAEGIIPADDVKLFFCDSCKGLSQVEALRLDTYGNIENWPNRFMGDAFTETAEAELARIKRRSEPPQ